MTLSNKATRKLIFSVFVLLEIPSYSQGAILPNDRNNLRSQLTKHELSEFRECGGTFLNQNAQISYKVTENYSDNERCVWTIVNTYYTNVELELTSASFGDPGDYVEIYHRKIARHDISSPTPSSQEPKCDGHLLTRTGSYCNLASSLIFIVFKSNGYSVGRGFTLKIQRTGTFYIPRDQYESRTLKEYSGWFNHKEVLGYTPYKWLTWTLTPLTKTIKVQNTSSTTTDEYQNGKNSTTMQATIALTIHKFNITTPPSKCDLGVTPVLTVYQTSPGEACVLHRICGSLRQPVTISHPSLEPYLLIYENGRGRYPEGAAIQFYWNMDQPPDDWDQLPSTTTNQPCVPDKACQVKIMDGILLVFIGVFTKILFHL